MNIFLKLFRWMPHPQYGKCGGKNRDCSPSKPIDWMDYAFDKHDDELNIAKTEKERKIADHNLAVALRKGNSSKLKSKFYGRLYLFLAKLVFKPVKGVDYESNYFSGLRNGSNRNIYRNDGEGKSSVEPEPRSERSKEN